MTVLVMDLVDSTLNANTNDPDDLIEALNKYRLISSEISGRFGGFLARQVGDGVDIYFGYPTADEDDAVNALHAALALVEAVQRIELTPGHPFAVRIGVATGLVAVSLDQGIAVAGTTPNLAARIQSVTPPGFVGVSPSTRRIAEGPIKFVDFGHHWLKGFETPIPVSLVHSMNVHGTRSVWRGQTTDLPMVGRDQELEMLLSHCQRCGIGQILATLVTGEAGIGKSRFINELALLLNNQGFTKLCLQSLPSHANTPLYPFTYHLAKASGFESGDSLEERQDKLEAQLAIAGIVDTSDYGLVASLLDIPSETRYPPLAMPPPKRLQMTKEIVIRYVTGLASSNPTGENGNTATETNSSRQLLLIIEDIHWLDPTSLDLLHMLLASPVNRHIVLIMTARPEFNQPWPNGIVVDHIRLGRIDSISSSLIAQQALTIGVELTDQQLRTIIERSDGIPLFIEELTREILEGNYTDVQGQRRVPETLFDLLRARLDRLPQQSRTIAQLAAVIGREFDIELLRIVAQDLEESFSEEGIHVLHASGLVLRTVASGERLRFKHALIEDTAYASISPKRRATLHHAVGSALVSCFKDRASEQPQLIANHFSQAGKDFDASHWWQTAATQALSRAAPREAATHLQSGIECLKRCPSAPENDRHRKEVELNLLSMLGPTMMVLYGPGSSAFGEIQQRAYSLSLSLPGQPRLFPISYARCLYHWGRSNLDQAEQLVTELLEKATAQASEREIVMAANNMAGMVRFHRGLPAEAQNHLTKSVLLHDSEIDAPLYPTYLMDFGVFGRFYLALCHQLLGDSEGATRIAEDAMRIAKAQPQAHTLGFAMLAVFNIALLQNKCEEVKVMATQCLAFAKKHGFPEFAAMAKVALGWAKSHESGNLEEGLAEMLQGLESWAQTGFENWQAWFAVIIAEIQTRTGMHEKARNTAETYLDRIRSNKEFVFEAPLLCELAAALHGLNEEPNEVKAIFSKAIEKAERQRARGWIERIRKRKDETMRLT